ncbi:MAG: hypothetical protein KatS3mg043_1631 [Rhodothermaceae bacterium]|nr:MAG: hypothetical protein KatS3mg043_1631 [Rhodothermaceae bacterium]
MTLPLSDPKIADLLLHCEARGPAPAYDEAGTVARSLEGGDLVVVSDLHLAEGLEHDGRYPGTENFFADDAFHRFLEDTRTRLRHTPAWLVLNGDVVDFMRITVIPHTDDDFGRWAERLRQIGLDYDTDTLRAALIRKERTFGLRTNDFKSVWKLDLSLRGHPLFLAALAEWMLAGHRLVIVRGNHDLEWYWLAVRNLLRLALAEHLAARTGTDLETVLRTTVLPHLHFIHDRLLFDREMLIEHGHVFDRFTAVVGGPVIGDGTELNIPFGSFFNRYLINRIELDYPYIDNVRPREQLLPLLVRERFPLALKLLFFHIPFALRVIPKKYYRYVFGRALVMLLAVGVPLGLMGWHLWQVLSPAAEPVQAALATDSFILRRVTGALQTLLWPILSYFLARIVAYLQLEEPPSLNAFARQRFDTLPDCRLITFGHTHNPDQFEHAGRWFYNTGTWVPVIEQSSAEVRFDRTFTFLHLQHAHGRLQPGRLQRWDDAAGRPAPMIIVKKKGEHEEG